MAASVALRLDLPMTRLGAPVTFAEGVREHQDEVYGVALRITGDRDAALDVASTTATLGGLDSRVTRRNKILRAGWGANL